MRLHYKTERRIWTVVHVPQARVVKLPRWVDDETCEWAELSGQPPIRGEWPETVHKAKKILIIPAKGLVLIDPVDDAEPGNTDEAEMSPGSPAFERWVAEDVLYQ